MVGNDNLQVHSTLEVNNDIPLDVEVGSVHSSLNQASGSHVLGSEGGARRLAEYIFQTPKAFQSQLSKCQDVSNKFYQMLNDESNHSKWEEFRKRAQSESMNEECANLLRRMELEDSDSDGETAKSEMLAEEEALSLGDLIDGTERDLTIVGQELGSLQEGMVQEKMVQPDVEPGMIQAKKRQKRHWGPALRVERPRRSQEDGRTMMQKAQDLKETRNSITGMTQKTSFAFESNEDLLNKAASVNISFGNEIRLFWRN
jgi:hypothetical protein